MRPPRADRAAGRGEALSPPNRQPAGITRRHALAGAAASALVGACAGLQPGGQPAPVVAAGAAPPPPPPPEYLGDRPPPAPREFRGAWVATVANIDWPSAPGLSAAAQRSEAIALMDRARQIGLNALILQVRPSCDAIYPSPLEPWTEYLSGEQGRAPVTGSEPAWDPLAFWVQEAHRRGLELHAWFNPYRARHSQAKSAPAASHVSQRRPELVRRYGEMLWMDPGEPEAAAHTLAVIADVVRRYDIDGVHLDDYFYPYPVTPAVPPGAPPAAETPFPDDEAYARYRLASGPLSRDDWRRANVDRLVEALYRSVHAIKPGLRVGISPFGIGKPELRPAGITGFSQYDKLYADAERWLAQGWLDYFAPQLYWPINREGQAFPVLLDYWLAQNSAARHLWPGLFTSQVARPPASWPAREILDQLALQRSRAAAGGHIHFSLIALQQDRDGLATLLQFGPYAEPALVPASPWLAAPGSPAPAAPQLRQRGPRVQIETAALPADTAAQRWAVWRRVGGVWRFAVLPGHDRQLDIAGASALSVQAVDRIGQLGEAATLRWP